MTINSRRKGKQGELEAVQLLKDNGFEARRGVQFAGGPDSPDIVHDIPNVHFEVKRTEKINVYEALGQAKRDGGEAKVPVVLHRRSREGWVAILPAADLLAMLRWMREND